MCLQSSHIILTNDDQSDALGFLIPGKWTLLNYLMLPVSDVALFKSCIVALLHYCIRGRSHITSAAGGGVSQKLTIAEQGWRGGLTNANNC